MQLPLDINDFDLDKADQEVSINITGPMHLAMRFLPHFKVSPSRQDNDCRSYLLRQSKPAATIINVGSVLGYVPFSIINPVYNGTKA